MSRTDRPRWDDACRGRLAWVNAWLAALDSPDGTLTCSDGRPDSPEHRAEIRATLEQEKDELLTQQFSAANTGVAQA